jgi:hypothetical protein
LKQKSSTKRAWNGRDYGSISQNAKLKQQLLMVENKQSFPAQKNQTRKKLTNGTD